MSNIQDGQRWSSLAKGVKPLPVTVQSTETQRGVKVSKVKPRPQKATNNTIELVDGVVVDIPMSCDQWADSISNSLTNIKKEITQIGIDILHAYEDIPKQEWSKFLNKTNMSTRVANTWISIGRFGVNYTKILTEPKFRIDLPTNQKVLAKLGRLSEEQLPRAIESGLITPETTESDVNKWKAEDEQLPIKPKPRSKVVSKSAQINSKTPKPGEGTCQHCGELCGH